MISPALIYGTQSQIKDLIINICTTKYGYESRGARQVHNKQSYTNQDNTLFPKEKGAALGGTPTHDTLLSRQSALPTELPGQAGL